MSEMIERVAKGMFNETELCSDQWGWDHDPPRDWDHDTIEECERAVWRRNARAAIEAMREPTEAMLDCEVKAIGSHPSIKAAERALWRAMIDAALNGD